MVKVGLIVIAFVWCRRPNIWWARRKAVEAINRRRRFAAFEGGRHDFVCARTCPIINVGCDYWGKSEREWCVSTQSTPNSDTADRRRFVTRSPQLQKRLLSSA